jgi:hypothetical protein
MDQDRKDLLRVQAGQRRAADDLADGMNQLEASQDEDADDLDELMARANAMLDELGVEANEPDPAPSPPLAPPHRPTTPPDWDSLLERYRAEPLPPEGFDGLLPPDVIEEIDHAFTRSVERAPWIRWGDFIAVGAAGLAGGLFDLFLNHGLLNRPDLHQKILHPRHAIDFPLGGHDHRVVGAGHDLFRFAEARQMLIDGKFEALFRGHYTKATFYRYGGQTFPYDKIPEEAATIALLTHWLADFFSTRSLPLPGWSFLTQNNDGVADFAIQAYRSGLNLRSLLSNFSGVLLTGTMLRLYTYLRQFLDTGRIDPFLWKDIKYQEMCLVAQSINLLMNLGKVAVTQNVFAINPVAIMAVIRHAIPVIRDAQRRRSPIAIMERNKGLLDQRWEELEVLAVEQAKASEAFGLLASGPALKA